MTEKENPSAPLIAQVTAMCADFVRLHDYERYVLTLFAPRRQRLFLFSLFALNIELKRIGGTVNDPMMRRIRLQWWRDALGDVFARKTLHHHVLRGIAFGIDAGVPWTEINFHALIDAHERTALRDVPADLTGLWADADAIGRVVDVLLQDVTGNVLPAQTAALDMLLALPDLPRHWVHGKITYAEDVPELGRNRLPMEMMTERLRPLVADTLAEIDRRVPVMNRLPGFSAVQATLIRHLSDMLQREKYDVFAYRARYKPQTLGFSIFVKRLMGN